jgi:endonuclease YncB( thermonuclease family)
MSPQKTFCSLSIALLVSLFIASSSFAWQGKVVGVSDGDSITVMHDGKGEEIRLYGVDCPEGHQDFGDRAKQFTSNMVYGKTVDVKPITQDRYGRTVGMIVYDRVNLSVELIRFGHAWVYRQYCTRPECKAWEFIEAKAKDEKNGLWPVSNPIPPWEFRRNARESTATPTPPPAVSASTTASSSSQSQRTVYHGNVRSHVFHGPVCKDYVCKRW